MKYITKVCNYPLFANKKKNFFDLVYPLPAQHTDMNTYKYAYPLALGTYS